MGLSRLCRFGGQCQEFYSVAQHSVWVYRRIRDWYREPEIWLQALLHDASEAYIIDVPSPLKQLLPEYRAIEDKFEAAIFEKFDLANKRQVIKRADLEALATEARDLMTGTADWSLIQGIRPSPDRIVPLRPDAARSLFFEEL